MDQNVDMEITQGVIAALEQQRQRLHVRLQNANNSTITGLEQFSALQQHSLKFNQQAEVKQFLDACCPAQQQLKPQVFEMDKFVDGSLSYTPKLVTRQLLQSTAVQLASQNCPNKQQVVDFARHWAARALKTNRISKYDEELAEIKLFELDSWQKNVASYAVSITPHVFMSEQLVRGLCDCTIVGCLAADVERLKSKL